MLFSKYSPGQTHGSILQKHVFKLDNNCKLGEPSGISPSMKATWKVLIHQAKRDSAFKLYSDFPLVETF